MIESYPLQWPVGYTRTPDNKRIRSLFKQNMEKAQQFLRDELSRLSTKGLVISTNIPVRNDGGLYSDWMRRKIADPGVAIYFKYKGKETTMCCDQYLTVWENIYALGKGIENLRGLSRWGVSDFIERAFTGFTALPSSVPISQKDIWEVMGLSVKPDSLAELKEAYKKKAMVVHPDRLGGDTQPFLELQWAYEKCQQFYN